MVTRALVRFRELRERLSLGTQIAIIGAVLCLVLTASASLISAQIARGNAVEQVDAELLALAGNMADRLDFRMFERFREIQNIAELAPLRETWTGGATEMRSVLEQLQRTLPEYAWIGFASPDGTVRAATRGMLEGASVAQRPWFAAGLQAPSVLDVHDAKLLAELLASDASGEPLRFVDVAVPVRNGAGEVVGVLGAHLSWSWAEELKRTALAKLDPEQKTEIWVLRASGEALLGLPFGKQPLSAEQLQAATTAGQEPFIHQGREPGLAAVVATRGHADYPGLGWVVVARRPLQVAFAPADQLTWAIVLAGVFLAAVGAAGSVVVASRMTRPLSRLAGEVDRIGRDPSLTMVGRGHGSAEILQLSGSVRSLLRRLGVAETAEEKARQDAADIALRMEEKTRRLGEDMSALQILADTDPLTRLLNRRAFQVYAADAMNYFRRYNRDLAILMVDIDFFKRVNDTYGHSVGDDVIQAVGDIVSSSVRTTDKVARFGGEEFVVLLREIDATAARTLADRIRQTIADRLIATRSHETINVTASIGLAIASRDDRDITDVMERADRALYRAKSGGRNLVVLEFNKGDMNAAA